MIGRYVAYPSYRESGDPRLGEIPDEWQVRQLKRAVDGCVNGIWGSEPTGDSDDIVVLRVADFDRHRLRVAEGEYTLRSITEKERNRRLLLSGDLLLEKSGGGEKTPVGQAVLFDGDFDAVCSNFVAKMTPLSGYNSGYLNYAFSSIYADGINTCSIKQNTGIQNLDSNAYLAEHWAFPPLDEQTQIAKFLDYETAKIDALIDKQQQLIALLQEKRQAVISHAVTKGLNPDAPMRDSGVEWLGEVPAHWAVGSLGYYAALNTGATPDRSKPDYWSGDIPWVKTGEVNYAQIDDTDEKITSAGLENSSVRVSPAGTLLMAMYGQGVTRGRVAILGVPASYNQACVAINAGKSVDNLFLRYFFMAAYHAIRDGGNETSQMNLNADIVRGFKIIVPPAFEQAKIITHLDQVLPKIDRLVNSSEDVVRLLQERRTALISAAVTGKIDVRGWQPPASSSEGETP